MLAAALTSPDVSHRCRAVRHLPDLQTLENGGKALLRQLITTILVDSTVHVSPCPDVWFLVFFVHDVFGLEGLTSRYVFNGVTLRCILGDLRYE